MIFALTPSRRAQVSNIERLRPEIYRLLVAPTLVGFVIGWCGTSGEARFASACIWAILSLAGWLLNDLFTRPFALPFHQRGWPLVSVLVAGFVVAAPLSVLLNFAFGEIFRFWGVPRNGLEALSAMSLGHMVSSTIAPIVLWLSINLAACGINGGMLFGCNWLARRESEEDAAPLASVAGGEPAFMGKVKPAVRGRVVAINAELHYVRVFTDRGEDLIHYRFCDAVADMRALGGLQVHRSWCVMADDIVSRSAQTVELQNGLSVPVGRVYKRELFRDDNSRSSPNTRAYSAKQGSLVR